MTIRPEELAARLAEADRRVVLLRRATLDMQALRRHLLATRSRESERSISALGIEIPDRDVRTRWALIRRRAQKP